jgi:hypothetical protein
VADEHDRITGDALAKEKMKPEGSGLDRSAADFFWAKNGSTAGDGQQEKYPPSSSKSA